MSWNKIYIGNDIINEWYWIDCWMNSCVDAFNKTTHLNFLDLDCLSPSTFLLIFLISLVSFDWSYYLFMCTLFSLNVLSLFLNYFFVLFLLHILSVQYCHFSKAEICSKFLSCYHFSLMLVVSIFLP